MAALLPLGLLLLAEASTPRPEDLLARGLALVERRSVVNPYAGIAREELVLERPGTPAERWRCVRWPDGTAGCAPAATEGG